MVWSICKGICWECGKFQQLASLVPRLGCKYCLIVQSYGFSYPFLPELLEMRIYAHLGHKPGVSLGTSCKKQLTTVRSFVHDMQTTRRSELSVALLGRRRSLCHAKANNSLAGAYGRAAGGQCWASGRW